MRNKIRYTFENVGTTYSQVAIKTPPSFIITRARAEILSGSGTKVAIRIKEKNTENDIDTVLEYDIGTVTHPLDSIESVTVVPYSANQDQHKLTYIAVKCDSGSNNQVSVVLDIEY